MAVRFATATGNWSNTAIWDNGALPTSSDTIYPNGFTVTIDQDITIQSLNNNISPVVIPNIATPAMTSNTSPTGTVISSNSSGTAYYAFLQDLGVLSWTGSSQISWVGYTFPSSKIIKRYYIRQNSNSGGQNANPKTWTFEGSNDGFATAGVVLDTVTGYVTNASYTSALLANTTAYTSYRLNVTVTFGTTTTVAVGELEMTESTVASPVYGLTTGGSFLVPSSLSGTRNIVQSGAGILTNSVNTTVSIAATSGATVNFNVSGGGYILNQNYQTGNANLKTIDITGNCTINFNSDIWGSQTTGIYNTSGTIYVNSNATINVNGNIYAAKGHASTGYYLFYLNAASCILNVTGNLTASSFSSLSNIITSNAVNTTNITGSLTSDLGICYYSTVGSILNIPTGTVTVTNLNSNPAIYMTSLLSLLTINSPIINKSNVNACVAAKMRFYSTGTPYWVFQNNLNADITLAYGSATGAYPNEGDVRFGTTYAASPTRTGTLRVPLPQYVSQGVLIDNTVGTAYLSASDVWNVLTSTLTTSGSIGERLKNASTIQTTGDQLASYIV